MRNKKSSWFEAVVRYKKMMEDGTQKSVTETYVVDAMTCTETETDVVKELKAFIKGDYKVTSTKETPYHEIFFSDKEKDDKWYKAKLAFITIDEKTEKERRTNVTYLVQAATLPGAVKNIQEIMGDTTNDYQFLSVQETKVIDVITK